MYMMSKTYEIDLDVSNSTADDNNISIIYTDSGNMTQDLNITLPAYCGKGLDDFHTAYHPIHGYAALLVCILGSIANSLNIVVLTRREMRSPTNAILTGLAIADLACMIDYIPFACHEYILAYFNYPRQERFTYSWAWYVEFHSIFAQICHTISIWLTVTLAVWRYIAVSYPQKNRIWCGMRTTLITIATSYIICPVIVIPPLFLSFSITPSVERLDQNGTKLPINDNIAILNKATSNNNNISVAATAALATINTTTTFASSPTNIDQGHNVTLYRVQFSKLAAENPKLMKTNFWIYSVIIKLIPCVALTILSLRLIAALLEAKRRRKQLTSNHANGMKQIVNGKVIEKPRKNSKTLEKEKQTDRTTKMLLAVLLLFLVTEFPQGILGFCSAILEETFFSNCYLKLGELMDILALINSGINFILYCSMSRQFRSTFNLLFRPKFLDRWLPVAQDDDNQLGRTDAGRDNNCLTTQVTHV